MNIGAMKSIEIADALHDRTCKLQAMLTHMCGNSSEAFHELSTPDQDALLGLCYDLAAECGELVSEGLLKKLQDADGGGA